MMSEVYRVGGKSFGLCILSKREEYCLIGKSKSGEEIIRKKSSKDRLSMMICFKVPYSQRKRRLTVDEWI